MPDCITDLLLSVTKLQGVWLWNFEGCARKTSKNNNACAKTVNRSQAINQQRKGTNRLIKNKRETMFSCNVQVGFCNDF